MSETKAQGVVAQELQTYFKELGIKTKACQQALYNDIRQFQEDPEYTNRRTLNSKEDNREVEKEWKRLVREVGPRHLNHRDDYGAFPNWREPDFEKYHPLRRVLLYLSHAWRRKRAKRQRKNGLLVDLSSSTDLGSPADVFPSREHPSQQTSGHTFNDTVTQLDIETSKTDKPVEHDFPLITHDRNDLSPSERRNFRKKIPFCVKFEADYEPEFPKGGELWAYYLAEKGRLSEGWYLKWPRFDSFIARPIQYWSTLGAWVMKDTDGSQVWLKRRLEYIVPFRRLSASDAEPTPAPRSNESEDSDAVVEDSVDTQSDDETYVASQESNKGQEGVNEEEALHQPHLTEHSDTYLNAKNDEDGDPNLNEPGITLSNSQKNGAIPCPELEGASTHKESPFNGFEDRLQRFMSQNMGNTNSNGPHSASDEDLPLLSSILRKQVEQRAVKKPPESPLVCHDNGPKAFVASKEDGEAYVDRSVHPALDPKSYGHTSSEGGHREEASARQRNTTFHSKLQNGPTMSTWRKRSLSNATDTDSNKRMPRPRKRSAHDALMRTLPDTKDSNLAGPQPFSRSAAASPQPLAKKATVKLCCCDRRGAWVEWRYGKLSDYHDFQSLFEKVAHSYSIQSEHVTGVSFFFADAKRKRAYTVPKGGEAEYQDMIGKIRAVLKDEKHQGSFQVHVEPVVESEDEIEIDW